MAGEQVSLTRRRGAAAWIVLLGTIVVSAVLLPSLAGRAARVALTPGDHPWVRLEGEIATEFGMENPVLWVVEGRQGTIWTPPVLERIVELTRAALRIPGVRAVDVMSLASPNVRQVRMTGTGIAPSYVMASVPPTEAAIAELRRRVESDENLAGTLVTVDGRAAVVVANFPADGDADAIARAALELRDRLSGPDAAIHVVGGPVLAAEARRSAADLAMPVAVAATGAMVSSAVLLGTSGLLAVFVAAVLTVLWSAAALLVCDAVVWPWSGLALPPTLLLAGTATAACTASPGALPSWLRVLAVGAASAAGFTALAMVVDPPVRAFGAAGAVGSLASAVAGRLAASLAGPHVRRTREAGWLSACAVAVVVIAVLGLARVGTSFALPGYGERYLPGGATEGLRSVARLMPIPTSLAIRVRGEPGFVADPAALGAMDGLTRAARRDRQVLRAQSLADLVKIVNRAFNDDDPSQAVIPDDRGLIARYLALAYSPAFRRFVDRGLGRTAIWVDLSSDRAADVARVLASAEAELREHPIPGGTVDLVGGDGAVLLVMAQMARRLVVGAACLVVATAAMVALGLGWRASGSTAAGAVAGAVVSAGGLGWLGLPLDLLTLSCVVGTAAVGAGAGAWKSVGDGGALVRLAGIAALIGLAALLVPLALAKVSGLALLGYAAAVLLAGGAVRVERPDTAVVP